MDAGPGLVALWLRWRRRCGGFWGYLTARTHARTLVALEEERNRGTAMVLRALPSGAELYEGDPGGYRRVVRMPQARGPQALPPPGDLSG
ncbi:hypothetical protein ACQEU3_33485 [Spirillospora sp. CA-253888]